MSRAGRGRPLRFVGAVGLGWIGLRIGLLGWEQTDLPPSVRAVSTRYAGGSGATTSPWIIRAAERMVPPSAAALPAPTRQEESAALATAAMPIAEGAIAETQGAGAASIRVAAAVLPPQVPVLTPSPVRRRWTGSAWLAFRPGQGIGVAPTAGQLGGSQYGVRLVRVLDAERKVAVFGRVTGPLRGFGAEAALGLEWRPLAAPVRIAIEQRFGLDGTRGGPGIGVVTGLDREIAGFRLETYGQAGVILRERAEPYADGALRLTRAVTIGGRAVPAIGIGAWGAAQRGARRLDIGPTVVAGLTIDGLRARIALDWRQRVAGTARPGSGVALTLGSDF